ncbi:unnamed protein product, partial [Dovyalis caffra]
MEIGQPKPKNIPLSKAILRVRKEGQGLDKSQICSDFHPTIINNKNERCVGVQKAKEVSTISKTNGEYECHTQRLISHVDGNLKQGSHILSDEDNSMCIKFISPTLKLDGMHVKDRFGIIGIVDAPVLTSARSFSTMQKDLDFLPHG